MSDLFLAQVSGLLLLQSTLPRPVFGPSFRGYCYCRRLCPDLFFFQRATEFPCEELVRAGSNVETLRKRVEHSVLKSETVARNRQGITFNVSCGEVGGGGRMTPQVLLGKEDVAMTGDVKTGHYNETWPGMGHWTGH